MVKINPWKLVSFKERYYLSVRLICSFIMFILNLHMECKTIVFLICITVMALMLNFFLLFPHASMEACLLHWHSWV